METTELKKYQEAFRKLEKQEEINEKKKFRKNLILFFIIIPLLLILDFFIQKNSFHWSLLPLIGWGSGILAWIFTLPNVDKTLPTKENEAEKMVKLN